MNQFLRDQASDSEEVVTPLLTSPSRLITGTKGIQELVNRLALLKVSRSHAQVNGPKVAKFLDR